MTPYNRDYNRETHIVRYDGDRYPILAPSYELATHAADALFGSDWRPESTHESYAPLRPAIAWHPQYTEAHNREAIAGRRYAQ